MAKRTPFAVRDSTLFVKAKYSGIHHLVIMCDGLPLTFFGEEKTDYMKVSEVIEWHEKELAESGGQSGDRGVLEALQVAMEKFQAGSCVEA